MLAPEDDSAAKDESATEQLLSAPEEEGATEQSLPASPNPPHRQHQRQKESANCQRKIRKFSMTPLLLQSTVKTLPSYPKKNISPIP